jgi:hypothetical protein
MKKVLWVFVSLSLSPVILSQTCSVSVDSLKGEYIGACKKGKADGFGTAVGVDSYTGNFKNGFPDGEGKYTWKNGTWYNGNWKKGLFEGNGTFYKVDENKPDSATLITGFWQGGKFIGKYKKPYSIVSLTNGISEVNARKIRETKSEITISVKSITGGGASLYNYLLPKPRLISVEIIEGRFQQQANNETSTVTNVYTLRHVTFPFQAIFTFETTGTNPMPLHLEKMKVEISEISSWYIHVNIDN